MKKYILILLLGANALGAAWLPVEPAEWTKLLPEQQAETLLFASVKHVVDVCREVQAKAAALESSAQIPANLPRHNVFFLGLSFSGKSTLINHLYGLRLAIASAEARKRTGMAFYELDVAAPLLDDAAQLPNHAPLLDDAAPLLDDAALLLDAAPLRDAAAGEPPIRGLTMANGAAKTASSCTSYPQVMSKIIGREHYSFWDLPGGEDDRGEFIRFINTAFLVEQARERAFSYVVCIKFSETDSITDRALEAPAETLFNYLRFLVFPFTLKRLREVLPSVLLCLTKVANPTAAETLISGEVRNIFTKMKGFMEETAVPEADAMIEAIKAHFRAANSKYIFFERFTGEKIEPGDFRATFLRIIRDLTPLKIKKFDGRIFIPEEVIALFAGDSPVMRELYEEGYQRLSSLRLDQPALEAVFQCIRNPDQIEAYLAGAGAGAWLANVELTRRATIISMLRLFCSLLPSEIETNLIERWKKSWNDGEIAGKYWFKTFFRKAQSSLRQPDSLFSRMLSYIYGPVPVPVSSTSDRNSVLTLFTEVLLPGAQGRTDIITLIRQREREWPGMLTSKVFFKPGIGFGFFVE